MDTSGYLPCVSPSISDLLSRISLFPLSTGLSWWLQMLLPEQPMPPLSLSTGQDLALWPLRTSMSRFSPSSSWFSGARRVNCLVAYFCRRIWIYRGNLKLSFIFFVSPSLPPTIARPQLQPGYSWRRRGALQTPRHMPSRQPHKANISWTSALMRTNFLSKHLKQGGAFSCHPLPGLILLFSLLRLEIKMRAFASFNERWQWLQHFRRELGKEGWLRRLSLWSLIHRPGLFVGSKATYLLLSTKSPQDTPSGDPAHAEIMALKGSVAQGFASLGRMGQEGEADTVELLGIRARSAKAGFQGAKPERLLA